MRRLGRAAAMAACALLFGAGAVGSLARADANGVVLRPTAELEPAARRVARLLGVRSGRRVSVGVAPATDLLESVSLGEVALGRAGEAIRIVYAVAPGQTVATELRGMAARSDADVRAVALAVESLLATPATPSPAAPALEPAFGRAEDRTPVRRAPRRSIEPIAKPVIHARWLLGYSPARGTPLLGPGVGLGLCVSAHCVVLEGDVSLLPYRSPPNSRTPVTYRFVNLGMRFQYRPFPRAAVVPGLSVGLLTRLGTASVDGSGRSETVSSLGLRTTVEGAVPLAGPFELVGEVGLDAAIHRARFLDASGPVLLEDAWTPWLMTSVRLRPRAVENRAAQGD